jgi:transposase
MELEAPMLKRGDWMMIAEAIKHGKYLKDIAAELGVHPRTVRRALARGGAPGGKRPGRRGSKLDPYKPMIDHLLSQGIVNGVVILREIQAKGYPGQKSILADYIRPKRALRPSRATVRFESEPGQQLQHDWAEIETEIAGVRQKVSFAVNTLGYSRRFHFWATERQDAEHTYEALIRAFEYFGGVTAEVLVDNQKSAVIAHRIGEAVRFNPRFVDLAGHYGFTSRACRPYRARTKGKDERMVGYVKHHFFVRYRSFESWAHLNQLAVAWLSQEADRRVHGTVKEVVAERFAREAPHLGRLPAVRFDTSYHERRVVAWDGYVEVRGTRYSVPDTFCGQPVTVRLELEGRIRLIDAEGEIVAEHRQQPAAAGWQTVPGHHARLWRDTLGVERRDLAVYAEVARCS